MAALLEYCFIITKLGVFLFVVTRRPHSVRNRANTLLVCCFQAYLRFLQSNLQVMLSASEHTQIHKYLIHRCIIDVQSISFTLKILLCFDTNLQTCQGMISQL